MYQYMYMSGENMHYVECYVPIQVYTMYFFLKYSTSWGEHYVLVRVWENTMYCTSTCLGEH